MYSTAVVLNLDATGSHISKPAFCTNKIMTRSIQDTHCNPVPFAEIMRTAREKAEMIHSLNKWCRSRKLVIHRDLKKLR